MSKPAPELEQDALSSHVDESDWCNKPQNPEITKAKCEIFEGDKSSLELLSLDYNNQSSLGFTNV